MKKGNLLLQIKESFREDSKFKIFLFSVLITGLSYGLYKGMLDNFLAEISMASNLYVQDLADNQDEVKATISTGVSINHVITIFIALFGGWIWHTLGIELLFILSAVLGLCNSAYAATIKVKRKEG